MKLNNSFFTTYKENVKDEDSVSSNLLVRSGMIKKSSSGVYMIMPLGYRVLSKIENVIRKEMESINSQELLMPSLVHEDIYKTSNRVSIFGSSVFTLKDRFNKKYVLGPTHEELFAILATTSVNSYKDLPFSLFQFQTKYRDETRPRYGLIRVREFIMKDSYTFDKDLEGLDISYNKMYQAYKNIFNKLELDYRIVKADTGVMGGLLSEEFQAITDIGEDTLVICENCDYASNVEIATTIFNEVEPLKLNMEEIYTPNMKKIEDLKMNVKECKNFVKTMVYSIDTKLVAIMIGSDYEVNEIKLTKIYKTDNIRLATIEEINSLNSSVGFVGPINLECEIIVDKSVLEYDNFVVGANKCDYHIKGVCLLDIKEYNIVDINNVNEGDICPCCKGNLTFTKGIEVGNTFKLGTKYSECFNLTYANSNQEKLPVVMGSYGIGIGRVMAAIVEQNNDEEGIIFPSVIAPYDVSIVIVNLKDEIAVEYATKLYSKYRSQNIDVVLDDRNERLGVKLNDMSLIGIPKIIIIGKNIHNNEVEIKMRNSSEKIVVSYDEL